MVQSPVGIAGCITPGIAAFKPLAENPDIRRMFGEAK
jgi:hypothetical protein